MIVVDRKIYDESLTLNSNIKLVSNTKGLSISTDKCYFTQTDSSEKYGLAGFVMVYPESTLKLTCEAHNNGDKAIEAIPLYEVRSGSIYGDVLNLTDGDKTPLFFEPNKTKEFSVVIPKVTTPGDYFLNFSLASDTDKSNTVSSSFNIKGATAKILNLSLDKDYFQRGETALLKLNYMNYNVASLSAEVSILNNQDKSCSKIITENLSEFKPVVDISIPIKSKCINPQVLVRLVDANGVVYSEKTFNVTTSSPIEKDNINILFIIIPLAVILLAIVLIKTKKNENSDSGNTGVPMGMLAIGFILLSFIFISNNKVEAAQFTDGYVSAYFTLTNGTEYNYNTSVAFTGGVIIRPSDINGDPGDVFGITLKVYPDEDYGGGYISTPTATGNGFYGVQGSVNAGQTRGAHNMHFDISYSYKDTSNYTRNKSVVFSVPYTVRKIGITVNKVSSTAIPYNTKDRISWEAIDAVECTKCSMKNNKGTVDCPVGFMNNSAPRLIGSFETEKLTEDTTFSIVCNNNSTGGAPSPSGDIYYQLFPCNSGNPAAEYKTATESWDSGTLVQGATGVYYIVSGSNSFDDPSKFNVAGITKETDINLCK